MVLSRNPYYDSERYPAEGEAGDAPLLADAGKPLPLIDQVVFTLEKETIRTGTNFCKAITMLPHQFGQLRSGGAGGCRR